MLHRRKPQLWLACLLSFGTYDPQARIQNWKAPARAAGIQNLPDRLSKVTFRQIPISERDPAHTDRRSGAYYVSGSNVVSFDPRVLDGASDELLDFFFLHESLGAIGVSDLHYGLSSLLDAIRIAPRDLLSNRRVAELLGTTPRALNPYDLPPLQNLAGRGGDGVRGGGDLLSVALKAVLIRHLLSRAEAGQIEVSALLQSLRVVRETQVERSPYAQNRGVVVAFFWGIHYESDPYFRPTIFWEEKLLTPGERNALLNLDFKAPVLQSWIREFLCRFTEGACPNDRQ